MLETPPIAAPPWCTHHLSILYSINSHYFIKYIATDNSVTFVVLQIVVLLCFTQLYSTPPDQPSMQCAMGRMKSIATNETN